MQPTHLKTEVDKYQLSIETCLSVSQVLTIDRKIWRVAGGRLLRQPPVSSRATWRHIYIYTGCQQPGQRCKKRQMRQIYLCYFFQLALIFGQFWVIFRSFCQFWVIFGQFWVIFGPFLGANFLWQNMHLCYLNRFLQL